MERRFMVADRKRMAICHVLVSTLVDGGGFLDRCGCLRRRADSTFHSVVRHFDDSLENKRDKRVV